MGSSGTLHYINLNKHSFNEIKEKMLIKLSESYNSTYDEETENYFFEVMSMDNFDQFKNLFGVKVLDYDSDEKVDYSGCYFPEIFSDKLVLYETDLCMSYQRLPSYCLSDMIYESKEIWT